MGQGGQFQFVNATKHDWVKTTESSHEMSSWSLPDRIPAMSRKQVYVEWAQHWYKADDPGDDSADTTYSIEGTSSTFTLSARGSSFSLSAQMGSGYANLGWNHDGITTFALAGDSGIWSWSGMDGSSWMRDNYSLLGTKKLRDIAITGSHDSGMSKIVIATAFGKPENTLTQAVSVGDQLVRGARYFDIRPVISGGRFATGHLSDLGGVLGWKGANGQLIQEIIDEINAFTNQQSELVILNISHGLNTDAADRQYRDLNQSEWNLLFQQLEGLQHRYSSDIPDLTQLPLSSFIGGGSAAVVIVVEQSAEVVGSRPGFYTRQRFPLSNVYAESNNLDKMAHDQFTKMANAYEKEYFALSWILTQSGGQAARTATGVSVTNESIIDLAKVANDALVSRVLGQDNSGFPNMIYTDYIVDARSVAVAMSLNCLRHRT